VTFALVRAYLETRSTVNSRSASRVLGVSPIRASNELCRWCSHGYLVRIKRGVFRDSGKPMRRENNRRVLQLLRDHGVASPTRVSAMTGLPMKAAVHACCDLVRSGKAYRVSRGIYAATTAFTDSRDKNCADPSSAHGTDSRKSCNGKVS
jgi:predicted transcriptional regulator of viral defense system